MMGYNVRSSSLDYVTYITKFVQACLCYQQTLDDNVVLHVVTMSGNLHKPLLDIRNPATILKNLGCLFLIVTVCYIM